MATQKDNEKVAKARSYLMSTIRSKNTKPELLVRRFLFAQGYRYRIHDKKLPGSPDITLPKYKTVIFVHGCFWHVHQACGKNVPPKNNPDYWKRKLELNVARDGLNKKKLRKLGYKVLEIWECELKKKNISRTLQNLLKKLRKFEGD